MTAPHLQTDRLTLNAHHAGDLPHLAAMWADPRVVRHIGNIPSTPEASAARLLRYQSLWPTFGFGYWAVRHTTSGQYLGDIGFADFARDITPSIAGLPEAGWVLASVAQGHGYAREALAAALAWLDQQQHPKSVCLVDPANAASLRLAARFGYRIATNVHLNGAPTHLLHRPRRPD